MTPEEGRYPSPITWHCESLPVVAMFTLSLFVGTREVWGMSHTGTPESPLKDTSCAGQESLTRQKAKETLRRGTKYGQK